MLRAAFLFPLLFIVGCNSVFYYPAQEILPPPTNDRPHIENITLTSADGVKITGWVRAAKERRRAILLHFHGNAENLSTHYYYVAWLADQGIELVLFDYRGYGESGGEPSREGTVLDGRAAVRFTFERARAANLPLYILGQSLGGAIAVASVGEEKVTPSALILESTFPSYRRVARKKVAEFWLLWPFQWPLSLLVSNDYDPEDYLDRIHSPVLVIHGDEDPIVPFENGEILFKKLRTEEKEFWRIEGGAHLALMRSLSRKTGSSTSGSRQDIDDKTYRERFLSYLKAHVDPVH